MTVEDLWGDFPSADESLPVQILREQAELLSKKTDNILQAVVVTIQDEEDVIEYSFDIVAPALNGYIYTVLELSHEAELYPLEIQDLSSSEIYVCPDEQHFKSALRKILGSEQIKKIVANLVALSTSESSISR
jgi:hypothetical protein